MTSLIKCRLLFLLVFPILVSLNSCYYIMDDNINIQKTGLINTVAGDGTITWGTNGGDSGKATSAQLQNPGGVFVDSNGNIFISDTQHQRIRKIDTSGIITTIAGDGTTPWGVDGGDGGDATSGKLDCPSGLFVDSSGNIFVADSNHHRIRKIDNSSTPKITTAAGTGSTSVLNNPSGVCVDNAGNIYISDTANHRIRLYDTSGNMTTIAGTGTSGYDTDFPDAINASTAKLNTPYGICFDISGNILIADSMNSRIRKLYKDNSIWKITTVAGGGSGDNKAATSAELNIPYAVNIDKSGNYFITDTAVDKIRRVDYKSGIISTIAGTGSTAFSGDGGLSVNANLYHPYGLCTDNSGNIFIADTYHHRIRKITLLNEVVFK